MKKVELELFSKLIDKDSELIPLITSEEEERFNLEELPDDIPILPLRNTVLFPGVVIPITVGRDKSIRLIQDVFKGDKRIGVISQKDEKIEEPEFDDLNRVGTIATVIRMLKMPDGNTTVIIQGKKRFEIDELIQTEPYFKARIKKFNESFPLKNDKDFEAITASMRDLANKIIEISPNIPSEASFVVKNIESDSFLVNFIASNLNVNVSEKQALLETADLKIRAEKVLKLLTRELQLAELKTDIQNKVKVDLDKQQRDYFLHQQMKTIQDELGDNPMKQEIEDLKKRAKTKKWNDDVREAFEKELEKYQRLNPAAAEHSIQHNYLDLLLELPWKEFSKDQFDLKRAQRILDRDHFGLEKVKERIIEHLAVLKLKGDMKSPILCLYGPPGVGKTSLGKSIAEALGRKYTRMSLGGLRDEAEIRGHRKTYIGAMPGRIIQNLKKAETSNPVFILDEIDKLSSGMQGDPASALLEVLDPEQNENFHDNYVDIDYDLSKVLFVATANSLSTIPAPLRDRMEIIEVNGYTVEEKVEIAKRHLVPKQLKENGISKDDFKIKKAALEKLIESYTAESGVRGMEKRISKLIRSRAKAIAMDEPVDPEVKVDELVSILGPSHERSKYGDNKIAGVVTGLAWTPVGGDILFIESSITKGKGKLTLTGNLGDVMKESAVIAMEYLKAHAEYFGLDQRVFDTHNVHIHVPEGATPKDGPSAGITILTALASLFTQRKVKAYLAMTGEITLRGDVLPVGGIKEKILAAKRANIKEIILSSKNRKHIEEIEERYISGLTFHYVDSMKEVIDLALTIEKVDDAVEVVFDEESNAKLAL
jgi:ATP-dependent Lon protease